MKNLSKFRGRFTTACILAAAILTYGFASCGNANPVNPDPFAQQDEAPIPQRILFSMDYSAAAYPECGWRLAERTASWASGHVPGGGPAGQDAIEMRQLVNLEALDWGGQYDWGWQGDIEPQDPPPGAVRYYRWRMRFSPESNFRGLSGDGRHSNITNKVLIVGQGCQTGPCRVVVSYRANGDFGHIGYFRVQIDGGVDLIETGSYKRGEWLDVQVEMRSSSTADTPDGGYKIWINSRAYRSPTAQRSGIILHSENWKYVWFGAYNNEGLAADGVHTWRHADFQVAETLDNTWSRR